MSMPTAYLLKKRWEDYLRVQSDLRQEKCRKLDRFLHAVLFAYQQNDASNPAELSAFADMKSICNILAGEFLVDMHHICQDSHDDDISRVQAYLLQGRGATLLRVLNTIGVQGLSSSRELGELLMSLLPLCVKFPCKQNDCTDDLELESIEACFSHLQSWTLSPILSRFPTLTEVGSAKASSSTGLKPEWSQHPTLTSRARRTSQGDSADSNSDSDDIKTQTRYTKRSRTVPLVNLSSCMTVGVFPGILTDPQTPDDDVDLDEGIQHDLPSLTPLELCLLMLNLVRSLCHGDCLQVMQMQSLSLGLLPSLSQLLYGLHTDWNCSSDADIPQGWTAEHISLLERFLVRIILTLASYISLQNNGLSHLNASAIMSTLMTVARQALRSLIDHPPQTPLPISHPLFKELQLAHDILYGVWLLMFNIFQSIPLNPSFLNNALKLLHDLHSHQSLHLIQNVLMHWEHQLSVHDKNSSQGRNAKECITSLITCMGRVMSALKKAKIDYIHTMKCVKRKHRNCEYSQYLHHHHDILGISSASITEHHLMTSDSYGSLEVLTTDIPMSQSSQHECAVAILGDFLLRIFKESSTKLLQVRTLCCMEEVGLCCCMVPNRIMRLLLQNLEDHTPGMRNYILCILTRSLLDHCGGSAQVQKQSLCSVCRELADQDGEDTRTPDTDIDIPRTTRSSAGHEFDSALSSSETSSQDDGTNKHPKWRCLRQFLPLIKHENEALSIQVTQHLLRIVSQGSAVFKQELFYCVFLPLLQVMKEVYPAPSSQSSQGTVYKLLQTSLSDTVVQYCLSALPLLLHSQPAQNMFLNCGGLRQLKNLIRISNFRHCVLKVFQVLIMMEDRQKRLQYLMQESKDRVMQWAESREQAGQTGTPNENVLEQPDESSPAWMSVIDAFIKIIFNDQSADSMTSGVTKPGKFVMPGDAAELVTTCDVWHTCSVLFPYSHMFRQKFLDYEGAEYAYTILCAALGRTCNVIQTDLTVPLASSSQERTSTTFQCWLSLIQSSLIICLTCCDLRISINNKELESKWLLETMLRELQSTSNLQGLALRALSDMLITCATTHPHMKDIIQNHTFAVMHLRIDDSDDAEVEELSDYCSTAKDSETCQTEQGYEADSEFTTDDISKGVEKGTAVMQPAGRGNTHLMLYPQLCHLVLDLLINHPTLPPPEGVLAHVLMKLISLAKQSAYIAAMLYNQGLVEILLTGLQKIITIKDPESTDVDKSIPVQQGKYSAEVRLLLDLFLIISRHTFSSRQLQRFLGLFQLPSTPVDLLLSVATALAESSKEQPTYILSFPVIKPNFLTDLELSVRSVSSDILAASIRHVPPSVDSQQNEYLQLLQCSGVQEANDLDTGSSQGSDSVIKGYTSRSALSCAPIQITLKDNVVWPANDSSFSLTVWLRLEGTSEEAGLYVKRARRAGKTNNFKYSNSYENSNVQSLGAQERKLPPRLKAAMKVNVLNRHWSETCLHLATLGSHYLQLEIWLDPETASIIVRLVGNPRKSEKILGEACISHLLVGEKWQHLAFSYSEQHRSARTAATVVAVVDGCYQKEVSFDYDRHQLLLDESSARDSSSVLAIGHAMTPDMLDRPLGSWQLGNLMLFRDCILPVRSCFHLYTLGPDCMTISQCDSSDQPRQYSHFINQDVISHSDLKQDIFTNGHNVNLQDLQEQLVMSYCPRNPHEYNMYAQMSRRSQPGLKTMLNRDVIKSGFNPLNQQSERCAVRSLTDLSPHVHHSLSAAINEIGGIGVFLFLFAKVVEQCDDEALQGRALNLLFTLICTSPHHAQAFRTMGGYAMLAKTLASAKCAIGYEMLKVLLDAALTRPVVRQDTVTRQYSLNHDSGALLRSTDVVTEVLLAWRVWDRAEPNVWQMALQAIEMLLRDNHPHKAYNFRQLHNISLVNKILNICLERIQEAMPSLAISVCQSMVNIIKCMVGTPPDIHVVITICDFLLLTHPAASTYVNHMPSQFYFMQKWGGSNRFSASIRSGSSHVSSTPAKMANSMYELDPEEEDQPIITLKRSQSMPGSPARRSRRKLRYAASLAGDTDTPSPQESDDRSKPNSNHKYINTDSRSKSVDQLDNALPDLDLPDIQLRRGFLESNIGWTKDTVHSSFHSSDDEYDIRNDDRKSEHRTFHIETCPSSISDDERTGAGEVRIHPSAEESSDQMSAVAKYLAKATTASNVNDVGMTSCSVGGIEKLDISTELKVDTSAPLTFDAANLDLDYPSKSDGSTSDISKGSASKLANEVLQVLLGKTSNMSPASNSSWQLFPSADSMKSISVSLNSTHDPDLVQDEELGLVTICAGLLELMCQILVLLRERDRRQIMGIILKPEVLIVMAHHSSPLIRTATIKLLDVYFHCSAEGDDEAFLQMQGFHLLASQLHQHMATRPLVEACFTMVLGKPISLDDEINVSLLLEMPKIQKMAIVPVLSLLERCVDDTALYHNTIALLIQIFETVPDMVPVLLDNALVETLCNVVSAINRSLPRFTDLGTDERSLLLEDVQHFFGAVAEKTFCTSGISYYQHLEDTLTLLYALEQRETETYGINSDEVGNVRSIQCHVFRCIFDFVSLKLEEPQGRFFPLRRSFSTKVENWFGRNLSHYFLLAEQKATKREENNNDVRSSIEEDSQPRSSSSSSSHIHWADLDQLTTDHLLDNAPVTFRKINRRHTFNNGLIGSGRVSIKRTASLNEGQGVGRDMGGVKISKDPRVLHNGVANHYNQAGQGEVVGANGTGLGQTGPHRPVSMLGRSSRHSSSAKHSSGILGLKKTELSQSELLDRFKKITRAAVDFVIFIAPRLPMTSKSELRLAELVDSTHIEVIPFEKDFARYMLDLLIRSIVMGMERSFFQRKTLSNTLMWQAKDVLRTQFSHLFTHLLAPASQLSERLYTLDLVSNEPKIKEILKITVHISGAGQKLVQYLYDLLSSNLEDIIPSQRKQVNELMDQLQACGFMPLRLGTRLSDSYRVSLAEDKKIWEAEANRERNIWLKKKETAKHRLLHKLETVSKRISGLAMEVTQAVVHCQNQQRKKFVEHIKVHMTNSLTTKKAWQQLIQQLTHERAVWHCPKSYPKSWQLDPTEGPCRVRRRLQRCHLGISEKFLKPQYRFKLEAEKFSPPLTYLFDEDVQTSDSAALIYRLHTNEKIEHTCRCISVTPSSETQGELLIGQTNLYFVGDEAILDANYTQVLLGNRDQLSMTLPQEDIKEVDKRWWQLKDNALEIFLTNGKTCLLSFNSTKERDHVYKILESLDLPNLIHGENLEAIRQLWLEGRMTNYEYLTHLNKLAGRSFNDLMQYPVFPFILATYESDTLDLRDPMSYRILAKPISVQQKNREEKYIENYRWLEHERCKAKERNDDTEYRPNPYHYGSHYSNSGTVLHFLVRLPPFTQMFLTYQDQNFDLPDRTFHSMQTAWRLASFQSTTDVKELIPEFFFLPEFLSNNEGFDFGVRQTGEPVWDILLPAWCYNNPRLFVLVHRQALESDIVTASLPAWIDLVFGYKQQGKAAIEAINVFHPATYFGIDVDNIEDPVRRNAIKTMIKTYGQTPKQLFKSPHPSRQLPSSAEWSSRNSPVEARKSPLDRVEGLRWGSYLGSPDCGEPVLSWSQNHGSPVATLVALPTGEVFGLAPSSHLLVIYSKEKGITAVNTVDVLWAAIVSWGHADNIIRVTNRKNAPAVNFLHWSTEEQVTCCASVPDCRLLFFGGTSGVVSVISTKFNANKPSDLQVFGVRQCLYGHVGPITAMDVCKSFSVLVTASQDHTCIIWDLNRLSYVCSINEHQHPVIAVSVSDTLGDIASVSHNEKGSSLMVHTINGHHIATVEKEERILSVTFSHAAEGRSVNIIAAGLNNGMVAMWSTWDLAPIRTLSSDIFTKPVISLTFTQNNQRLYASNTEGKVVMWEKAAQGRTKAVNFIPFL